MTQSTAVVPARVTTPMKAYLFLAAGIVGMACAAIFIRYAQAENIPSLFIAAGRLTVAALVLTPFALRRHWDEVRALRRSDLLLAAVSGTILGAHFATWIASLEYTSVLISVVLVATSPLWVALLELVFLRVSLRPLVVAGLVVAMIGGVLIGLGGDDEFFVGKNPVLGGLLSLSGALAIAVYLVIGRKLRARLSLLPYIWLVYGWAAIALMLAVAITQTPVAGYSASGYVFIVMLALIPQLIGHSSINYALRYLPATFISILTQTEVIGSAIAAFVLFREVPAPLQMIGGVAILTGVILASLGQQETKR